MEQPLITSSQLEPENKSLGCLFMKLEGIVVQPELPGNFASEPEVAQTTQIELHLTIQFREQRELLVGGHIKFGLKGGRLRIKLQNAQIPLAASEVERSFELSIPKKKQPPAVSQNQSDVAAFLPENKLGVKLNLTAQKTAQRSDQYQFIPCQVTVKGSQENPTWVFTVDRSESILKGLLKNVVLTTLDIRDLPCCVDATFEVLPQDVYLTEAEGLWPKHISKKRTVVIERAIARRFLEEKLKPYLSRQKLQYD